MVITTFRLVVMMRGHLIGWPDEHFCDRAGLIGVECEIASAG
jgi:hypothetical protein